MTRGTVVTVSVLVACGLVAVLVLVPTLLRGDPERGAAPTASTASTGPTAPAAAVTGDVPVCGIPDLAQVVDDGVDHAASGGVRTVADDVLPGTGELISARVSDGTAYVVSRADATYTVARYALDDGRAEGETVVELDWDGRSETFGTSSFEVGEDGSVYLLDTLMGRRDLVKVAPDGTETWRTTLPEGPQTTGAVLDLEGTVVWEDSGRGEVVGVVDAQTVLHRVGADGALLEPLTIDGAVLGQLDGGAAVLTAARPAAGGDRTDLSLTVVESDGAVRARLGSWAPVDPDLGVPSLPWTGATGAGAAPGGGLLLAEPGTGLRRYGTDGVLLGTWPDVSMDVEQPFTLADRTPVLQDGGTYYVLTDGADGGLSLTAISRERMAAGLQAPVTLTADSENLVAVMGLGAGLLVDRPYGVFAAGEEPQVAAVFDEAWGAHADRYRLRYQVRGDPRVPDPVVGEERLADLPSAGGEVELDLPPSRPGVYEVDAALVDDDGTAVSGACLRYTVTPEGSALDPASLADGADWGGAQPLRGVQLAAQLGVGSHRVQLDFGALVPDPTAEPGPAGVVWASLPGATVGAEDGETEGTTDPFADLAAAAREADRTGVRLVVQVGQGGDAERAAAEAGTWEGWVRQVVAGLQEHAPGIEHWSPWNEPNGTGYEDAARYESEVGAPFARGVRAVDPDAVVVGGNTLGLALDWWSDLVAAGGCASMDVAGIHPYTGHNRSWEEEGFSADGAELDQLREILRPCDDRPVWDTETGWWSDGVVNFWATGWDVARKLWWYALEDVEEWTYFFSEGGFGESGNSWSLLQYDAYVKPAGAAMAATAPVVAGLDDVAAVSTGTPGVHAMRGRADDGTTVLALWSEELSTSVVVTPRGGREVEVARRDVYGAEKDLTLAARGTEVPVTGSPVQLRVPAGAELQVRATEPFGDDVLEGRPVSVSSTHPDAGEAGTITSGTFDVREPWRSGRLPDGSVDPAPTVEIGTDGPVTVDRIAVATAGIRCCTAGLRDYTVAVRAVDGGWRTVATRSDQLWDRVALFEIDPVEITAVRVSVPWTEIRGTRVLDVNYSGVLGGPPTPFMPLATESDWLVAVSAVRAWGPAG
ncbi:hypothetical protein M1843_13915 [Isoptericola sp. 4D.3]|uniref:F5/8 type C domain-containing protein n=1 Tax=Isoptericola peretonis TaxID=2918523 RepID=A0ABT0J5R4_9MICO|nr:hypothetical protein [Isoptericola sp. 4D.3]